MSLLLALEWLLWCEKAGSMHPDTEAVHTLCTTIWIFFSCTAGSAFGEPSDWSHPSEGFVGKLKCDRQVT